MLLYFLSVIMQVLIGFLIAVQWDQKKAVHYLLSAYLFGFGHLILLFNTLNLFAAMNQRGAILAGQAIVLTPLIALSIRRWQTLRKRLRCFHLPRAARTGPFWIISTLTLLMTAGSVLLNAALIYVMPPNNNDALAIHMGRVVEWFQRGSYFPWETNRVWQLTFPINAELPYLHTLVFTRADHFIGFFPFFSGLLAALAITALFYDRYGKPWLSLFVGMVWLSFPAVQLNLTSTRHDLVSTALLVIAFYFLYYGIKTQGRRELLYTALALGISIGTNYAVAIYLPGFGLTALFLLLSKRLTLRAALTWGAAALIAFFLFSSEIFLSNQIHFGSPLPGDAEEMTIVSAIESTGFLPHIGINLTRWLYQMLDVSGIPQPLMGYLLKAKASIARGLFSLLGAARVEGSAAAYADHVFALDTVPVYQEDSAWYGLLGSVILFPWLLIAAIRGIGRKDWAAVSVGIFFVSGLLTMPLVRSGWAPYYGRYFMPLSALSMLLIGGWFEGKHARWIQGVMFLLAASALLLTVAYNPAKSVIGDNAVWQMHRLDKLSRQAYDTKGMLYLGDPKVPSDAVLGVATPNQFYYEYGLYGEQFTRAVRPVIDPADVCDPGWLKENDIEYLLVETFDNYPPCQLDGYEYFDSLSNWVLLIREDLQ